MGLSFLKRKKNRQALVDDGSGNDQPPLDSADWTASRFAVLQPANEGAYANLSNRQDSLPGLAVLQSASGSRASKDEGHESQQLAALKPASRGGSYQSSLQGSGGASKSKSPSVVTPVKSRSAAGSEDDTPITSAQTPSPKPPYRQSTPTLPYPAVISPPNTQDETPLHSNQSALNAGMGASLFSSEFHFVDAGIDEDGLPSIRNSHSDQDSVRSAGAVRGPPGLPMGKKPKKKKKKKKIKGIAAPKKDKGKNNIDGGAKSGNKNAAGNVARRVGQTAAKGGKSMRFFLQPSKRDTVPIATGGPPADGTDAVDSESQYQSNVVEYVAGKTGEAGVELEIDGPDGRCGFPNVFGIEKVDTDNMIGEGDVRADERIEVTSSTSIRTERPGEEDGREPQLPRWQQNQQRVLRQQSRKSTAASRRVPSYPQKSPSCSASVRSNNTSSEKSEVSTQPIISKRGGKRRSDVTTRSVPSYPQKSPVRKSRSSSDSTARKNLESLFGRSASDEDGSGAIEEGKAAPATAATPSEVGEEVGEDAYMRDGDDFDRAIEDGRRNATPPRAAAPPPPPPGDPPKARTRLGYISQQDQRRFLSKLRGAAGKRPPAGRKPSKQKGEGRGRREEETDGKPQPEDVLSDVAMQQVPEFITDNDEQSMPSLLTEPESMLRRRTASLASRDNGTVSRTETPQLPTSLFPTTCAAIEGCANEDDDASLEESETRDSGRSRRSGGRERRKRSRRGKRRSKRDSRFAARSPTSESAEDPRQGRGDDAGDSRESDDEDDSEECATVSSSTYLKTTLNGLTATVTTTAMSAASQAGGIERFLGVFQCGGDTTAAASSAAGAFGATVESVKGMLRGERPLCGRMDREKDAVDLLLEEEEAMVQGFLSEMIKRGVKLIYHQSPSRASINPDWIQSTVKLFLRPGSCHGDLLRHPSLAWAVLPVVSRRRAWASFDASDGRWNTLGLLDVHSILVDEGDGRVGGADGDAGSRGGMARTRSSRSSRSGTTTGFFSVTAADGRVHVFEAPSAGERDRVVEGLRSAIARLTYHVVAGDADIIEEMYGEEDDATATHTGELPSLSSPWRGLGRVTHAFLDRER